jgi:hypothetical protein
VWKAALDQAAADGSFLYSFSLFITTGRKVQTGLR